MTGAAWQHPSVIRLRTAAGTDQYGQRPVRALPGGLRRRVQAIYGYARHIRDLPNESMPESTVVDRMGTLAAFEAELWELYGTGPVRHPVLKALRRTCGRDLPLDPLLRLIEGNRVDHRARRYRTLHELAGFCTLCANPIGELILHTLGGATPQRLALSDR